MRLFFSKKLFRTNLSYIYRRKITHLLDGKDYLSGLVRKDKSVIDAIYRDFARRIAAQIKKWGGTREDAKDVFHDALMIIYQKAQSPEFELTAGFYTYLHSVCYFIWDRKRKKKANNTVTIPDRAGYKSADNIEAAVEARERDEVFRESLNKLGSVCQQILRLFFRGTTMERIAQLVGLDNAHVARTRKYRCTKKLEEIVRSDVRYRELRTDRKAKSSKYG